MTGKYKITRNSQTLSRKNKDKKEENKIEKKIEKEEISAAEKKAQSIIEAAEKEAKQIRQEAEAEKEKIIKKKEKIYSELKEKAEAEGLEAAQTEVDRLKSNLADLIANFEAEFSREKDRIRKDIIELAIKIASIVIDVKLEVEADIINNIIADMLTKIDDNHNDIVVRVNPELIPYVAENQFYQHINKKNIDFVSDPELKKGDCVVETNLGGKEGSLEHKLDLIKTELLKEVEQHD